AALGVSVAQGRTLRPEDDQAGAAAVAVISHRYSLKRFGGETAIGRSIVVNQTLVTIVGVMASDFHDTVLGGGAVDLTLPLALAAKIRPDGKDTAKPGHWWLHIMGRLKPGTTREQ